MPSAMPEERRVVTALFADVAGSTHITEQHGAEEARLILGEAIARAVRIVEGYGGTIKDLAGDGMLAIFGAPVAHEDDPERAVLAGLEIAAAISEYADEVRRGWGVSDFGVRLGIETGEVVAGLVGAGSRIEYGATGDAINVAARLQSRAEIGQVLAGPQTRRMVEGRFELGEGVALTLKGKSEPVSAAPVLRPRAGDLPPARSLAPLVGREAELAALRESLDALAAGRGGIVFLSGEPGIGKSRLFAEMRVTAAAGGGVEWLEGRAVSYGAALAWWPVRDLLRNWLGAGAHSTELRSRLTLRRRLEELSGLRAAELQPFLLAILGLAQEPGGDSAIASLSPEALQFRSFEVFGELIAALAARRPLVLAIDDLHWADATTLGLLDRLLPLAETAPILFLLNHRPETGHASWALRERAQREFRHLVLNFDLKPLDGEAERRLLAAIVDGPLSREVEERVIGYADGNPLFLEEMARAIGEGGAGATGAVSVPATIEGVILARLDRLEPEWREILAAASCCGRAFALGLVAAVAGRDEAELRPALHHLMRLDLLQEERRWPDAAYHFKHALIQETTYRTLVTARRREFHRRAATWFEQHHAASGGREFGLLAHHWLEADDLERAAHFLQAAGEQALQEWALDEAIGYLRSLVSVLERSGRGEVAARPLYQLASTLHLAMRFGEANAAWQEATRAWRPPPPAQDKPTATLVIGVGRVPWTADPYHGFYSANLRLAEQLHDALLVLRPGLSVEPGLADRLEVDDRGLLYRIHLRPGLRYRSGRVLDAAVVVDNLRYFLRESADATILWVARGARAYSETGDDAELGIRTAGDLVVELELDEPDPAFHLHLTQPHFGVARLDDAAGPFELVELAEERTLIEADGAYGLRRQGNVRRVEWRAVPVAQAIGRLASGELDGLVHYQGLVEDPGPTFVEAVGPPVFLVALAATGRGPIVDLHLRRALALAVDRDSLHRHTARHQVIAWGGIVPPGVPGHTPGIAPAFSPDAARQALARSSHRGPLQVALYREHPNPALVAAVDGWREVLGLQIDIQNIALPDNQRATREVHVIQLNWVAHVPDPAYFLAELFESGSRSNILGLSDRGFDSLVRAAAAERDGPRRMARYHEADRAATAELCFAMPILYASMVSVLQPWVRGWWEWGNPNQLFSELVIDPSSPRYSE